MSRLPIPTHLPDLLKRLAHQEQELARKLAELEDQVRAFEDQDRPAYESWLRLEFGPQLSVLEELYERIRVKRILVSRVEELIENQKLHPREALYVAMGLGTKPSTGKSKNEGGKQWDAEEIEARRRAKKEAKREKRKQDQKQKRIEQERSRTNARDDDASHPSPTPKKPDDRRKKLVSLYRALARKLHPDTADSTNTHDAQRNHKLWLEVQEAYDTSNYERLLAVATWLEAKAENAEESALPSLSIADRFERLRAMGVSRYKLQKNLAQLSKHPGWKFTQPGAQRKKLRQKAARELEDEIAGVQEALDAYDEFIESIGTPRPPRAR